MKNGKKRKRQVYEDLVKLPDLKAKSDAFVKYFTSQAFSNKIILEEAYKSIAFYMQASFPFLQAFPELLIGDNKSRTRTLLKEYALFKAINTLYSGVVKMKLEQELIKRKIVTMNKNKELVATSAFKAGKRFFDWDKTLDLMKKDALSILLKLLKDDSAVISQILIEMSVYTDVNGNSYYAEFMFLEGYIYLNGYEEFLKNIDNMERLFQEKVVKDFIENTSFEFFTKFKENSKITFITEAYKTEAIDKIKNKHKQKILKYCKDNKVRLTFVKNEVLDDFLLKMSNELNKTWRKYGKQAK